MRDYLVETATVTPRPTAVVRQTTTWEEFPRFWGHRRARRHVRDLIQIAALRM